MSDILEFLAEQASAEPEDFAEHLYTYYDDGAVAHLFGVTAGLDSMIIGEGEILGQVRDAWQLAEQEGASGQLLSRVFRQALVVGKRARTETAIGRSALSISSAAVALAEQTMFSLRGRSVLVLGAGEVAAGPRPRAGERRRRRGRRGQPHVRPRGRSRRQGRWPAGDPRRPARGPDARSTCCSPRRTRPRCTSSGTTSKR